MSIVGILLLSQLCEMGAAIILILQIRKLRLGKVKQLAQARPERLQSGLLVYPDKD